MAVKSSEKYFCLSCCLYYSTPVLSGQNIRVLSALTGEPVANAIVTSDTKVFQADENGRFKP
jgi:hypothetical protein